MNIQVALTLCCYLAKYIRIAQSETCINRNFTLCEFSWETKNAQSEGYLYLFPWKERFEMKIWRQVIFWISRMWKFLIQEKIKILEISRIGKYVNITYFAIRDFILYEAKNWKIREHCVLMRRGQYWKIRCFLVYKE